MLLSIRHMTWTNIIDSLGTSQDVDNQDYSANIWSPFRQTKTETRSFLNRLSVFGSLEHVWTTPQVPLGFQTSSTKSSSCFLWRITFIQFLPLQTGWSWVKGKFSGVATDRNQGCLCFTSYVHFRHLSTFWFVSFPNSLAMFRNTELTIMGKPVRPWQLWTWHRISLGVTIPICFCLMGNLDCTTKEGKIMLPWGIFSLSLCNSHGWYSILWRIHSWTISMKTTWLLSQGGTVGNKTVQVFCTFEKIHLYHIR